MAHIHRLILLVLALFASPVWASFPAATGYRTTIGSTTGPITGDTASSCSAAVAAYAAATGGTYRVSSSTTSSTCYFDSYNGTGWNTNFGGGTITPISSSYCPSNSTLSGGQCTCASGYTQNGSTCQAPAPVNNCPPAGTELGEYTVNGSMPTAQSVTSCDSSSSSGDSANANCAITIKPSWGVSYAGGSGWGGKAVSTGAKCTASPTDASQNPCTGGLVPGKVNGVTVCYRSSTGTQTGPTETSTTPSSGGGGPGSTPPNTTSSETSTTCAGGKCTTTTTYRDSSGGVTGTSSRTEDQADYCKDHPKAIMCVQSSWSGGACDAVPACDGDPVFCAIAQSDFKTKCALNPDPGPESDLYHSEKTKTGSVIGDLPGSGTSTIGAGSFDQTERFSASGLSDLSITVAGRPVTLQISVLNPWLVWMGNLLVAVSFLAAMAIVFKGQN